MSNITSANPSKEQTKESKIRGIIAFPSIDDFYNELMDRLHMVLDQFFLEEKFTIFINGLPRDHEPGTKIYRNRFAEDMPLIYGGLERQRNFLKNYNNKNDENLNEFWNLLLNDKLNSTQETLVSQKLFFELRRGNYELSDIEKIGTGKLTDYFAPKLYPELQLKPLTKAQEAEYEILNHHFDIYSYRYLSVPLIQFAEFDGVVHIILSEKDFKRNFSQLYTARNLREAIGKILTFSKLLSKKKSLNTRILGNIIKAFSREYEGLILDWDIVGDPKIKEISFLDALDVEKFYSESSNPILNELKYLEYYEKHSTYFKDRFKYNEQVPLNLRQQYRQIAVIHILIDSYAHNISAHSLTALEWWFRQRADMLDHKQLAIQEGKAIPQLQAELVNSVALLEQYDKPLDKEIHPLLRFLLDKGAFWTGLTRDNSFGGRIISLYNVLWRDFINNPLYLGTIAFTEGIVKLHIRITFLKYKGHEGNMRIHKEVELDGVFAHIDLTKFQEAKTSNDKKDLENSSDFVIEGNDYEKLSEKLRSCKAFFPAGVVGEHAFFTILETELRNVKHYKPEDLVDIREKGLILNISIEEDSYRKTEDRQAPGETHYYKIGVWLGHPFYINEDRMLLRPRRLYNDIIEEETFLPRLGGTYQDKVCAAMLFNNSFASVENKETVRDKRFYPWVKSGSSSNLVYKKGDTIEDFEVSARRMIDDDEKFGASKKFFAENFQPHLGYFKKFFHIWKGENIYAVENIEQLNEIWENVSRFRFVCMPSGDAKLFQRVREMGIIRTINTATEDGANAYHQWLKKWLKLDADKIEYKVEFSTIMQNAFEVAFQLDFNDKEMRFYNNKDVKSEDWESTQEINLIHNPNQQDQAGNQFVRYRNHGIFKEYFCNRVEPDYVKEMPKDVAAELLEIVATRICIFDNRIAGRFKEINTQILTDQLHCTVYDEDEKKWQEERKKGFFRYNFLVVHLSFIEALKDEQGNKKYDEKDIQRFINDEILNGSDNAPENFILVITTGRGRTHWWDKLKSVYNLQKPEENIPPYTSFVTFRPVESLTASIENAITLKDDIELKYRLTKVLFGS